MKFFYNDAGEIIGTVDADPEIEAGFGMPGMHEMTVTGDVAEQIRNPKSGVLHTHYTVQGGRLEKSKTPPRLKHNKDDGYIIKETRFTP